MNDFSQRISQLSPEKRALLERHLKERSGEAPRRPALSGPGTERSPLPPPAAGRRPGEAPALSLFYFSSNAEPAGAADALRLLLEGAEFADRHGFEAVWFPERHFHKFGGLFPNPAVTASALASRTRQIHLRAGSVVLPLHNPLRVAEEWAFVDLLSQGRVGLAFASGWHANDFVLNPPNYRERREVMFREIQTVQRLWRGEPLVTRDGLDAEVALEIFPKPVQPELPVWITAAGNPETYVRAGAMGANVLTHLLGQSFEQVAAKIARYREARAEHGHDPRGGQVTLMLHTFVGTDLGGVREIVREPFCNYLRSFTELLENLGRSLGVDVTSGSLSAADMNSLLSFAFERYFNTSGLFGTPETCLPMIDQLERIGVDEIACLIDFGVPTDAVLESLTGLDELRRRVAQRTATVDLPACN
jgi:natural product biosynthesis luciferase-like monooxygenase protein